MRVGGLGAQLTWMTSLGSSAWLECISAAAPTRAHMSPVGHTAVSVTPRALWSSRCSLQMPHQGEGNAPALPHSWQNRNPTKRPDFPPLCPEAWEQSSTAAPQLSSIPTHLPPDPRAAPAAATATKCCTEPQSSERKPSPDVGASLWLCCEAEGRARQCFGRPVCCQPIGSHSKGQSWRWPKP